MSACVVAFESQSLGQKPVDANNAASIVESTPATQPAAVKVEPQAKREAPTSPTPAPAIIVPPASESRSLGRAANSPPRTSVGDTVALNPAARQAESSSWLGVLDPRRNEFTRVLGALAAVVGLILLARTVAVRYMPSLMAVKGDRPSGVIEVLARYPIGRGQQLLVLKFARRILLVHQAGTAARTLTEMTDPDEVAATLSRLEAGASAGSVTKFRDALKSFERDHEAVVAQRSRSGAALAAGETEIIDLTRTQIRGIGGNPNVRRVLR